MADVSVRDDPDDPDYVNLTGSSGVSDNREPTDYGSWEAPAIPEGSTYLGGHRPPSQNYRQNYDPNKEGYYGPQRDETGGEAAPFGGAPRPPDTSGQEPMREQRGADPEVKSLLRQLYDNFGIS